MAYESQVEEVRVLLERLDSIDNLFARERRERDLAEKLAAAADAHADRAVAAVRETRRILRTVVAVVALGLVLWTPFVAYGAVWVHERVRNSCYPALAELIHATPTSADPWYCGLFPGTGRPDHVPD